MRRSLRMLSIAVATLVVAGAAGGVAAGGLPWAGSHPAVSPGAVGDTCSYDATVSCVLFDGLTVSMAAPLLHSSVRGNDGGSELISLCCVTINPSGAHSAAGTVNGQAVSLLPSGGETMSDVGTFVKASGSSIHNVAGTHYRYSVYYASLDYHQTAFNSGVFQIEIQGNVRTYDNCIRHSAVPHPLNDCAPGRQHIARGTALAGDFPAPGGIYTVSVPLTYLDRPVAPNATGLPGATHTSTGHWSLRAAIDPHGSSSLWSTEWSIGGVDVGRESGASNILTATNFPIATHSDPYTI